MGRLNKPAKPGYEYRAPERTNAYDLMPHPQEDVGPAQEEDFKKIGRGLNTDRTSPQGRRSRQEAGGRATIRTGARAGLAGLAFEGGKQIGEEINRRFPQVGEAVDTALDKTGITKLLQRGAVPPGRVELTDDAKRRIAEREMTDLIDKAEKRDSERQAKRKSEDGGEEGYAKGGMVGSASKRADGCAQRGKTRGKYL